MNSLSHILTSGKIPHSLLLSGGRGAKLAEAAQQFARDLVGKIPHPDVHEYFPEGKIRMHPISHMRQLTDEAELVPYEGKWKIFIVHEADRMLPTSSHALLKTFEEPTKGTVIMLLSHHPEKILPTILSRCQKIELLGSQKRVEHKILEVLAGKASIETLDEDDQVDEMLETILLWHRDRMLLGMKGGEHYLTYPEYRESIAHSPFVPLEKVEKALAQVRLGIERSIKLTTCLEALFFQL